MKNKKIIVIITLFALIIVGLCCISLSLIYRIKKIEFLQDEITISTNQIINLYDYLKLENIDFEDLEVTANNNLLVIDRNQIKSDNILGTSTITVKHEDLIDNLKVNIETEESKELLQAIENSINLDSYKLNYYTNFVNNDFNSTVGVDNKNKEATYYGNNCNLFLDVIIKNLNNSGEIKLPNHIADTNLKFNETFF